MSEQKRLKKNISFSEYERDIYDYLNSVKNASALIKRLVYNHMLLEKGLIIPTVANVDMSKQEIVTETKEPEKIKEKENIKNTENEKEEQLKDATDEQAITMDEEPKVPTEFSDEDLINKEILPDL